MAKKAFLLLSLPERPGKFANPLTDARQLDEAEGVSVDGTEHAPDVAALEADGYELHLV
ncbi:hypothetical protein [Halovenus sp. HT40]|uniref:hypothetical protein n=1 Tax=Halovenus sp. HT40 TaxID=3126691 RepID=UPI00300E854A